MYVVVGRIGLELDAVAGFATLVWAPTGISLAALLIRGHRLWPAIFVGAVAVNLLTGAPVPAALGIGAGNTLEALIGAYALQRIPGFRASLDRLADVFGLIVLAAFMSTAVSATIGVLSLYLSGIVPAARIPEVWRAWWVGDLIGDLLVAPMLLVWSTRPRIEDRDRALEAGALGMSLIAVGLLVFARETSGSHGALSEAYLFFPLLMWAAVRFGQRGSVTAGFIISLVAVWGTVLGHGPFVQPQLNQSLFALQTFLGVTAATFLVLGASISERAAAIDRLEDVIIDENRLLTERDAAHQRLLAVLEQTPLAVGIAEAPSGRFLFVNDEVERLTGSRPALIKAAHPAGGGWNGSHADGSPIATDEWPMARALGNGEIVRNEIIRIARDDGIALEIMANAAPVRNAEGEIVAAVMIFWDITAQRQADQELRRAHVAAAEANRAKSEFLAVMSHELRTPLNAIGGHVQLIEMGVHGPVSEAQREALVRVQRSQRHLLSLINDLLNLTRIETGRVEYDLGDLPLEPLVAEVTAMVEPLLSSKQLQCEIDESPYAPDPAIVVRADRDKVQQILLNLLTNAIKFTPSGGRITVAAAACAEAPAMAAIRVTDSGGGIPPENLEKIFEPFVQLGGRSGGPGGGVGLGLAISRDLARGMGGDLSATSSVAEGSVFTLLLPRA